MTNVVTILFLALAIYLIAGILFAVFFLLNGIEKIDTTAHGSGWGFRLIVLPGTIVFWPVLLNKWIKVKKVQHDKTTA